MIPMQRPRAKILFTRFLVDLFLRDLLFIFSNCLTKQPASSSIAAFSRELRSYLPQVQSTEAIPFVLFILLVLFVTPQCGVASFLCNSYGRP
jgi:hypothetical protein